MYGGVGYNNPNLYGMVMSQVATVCINNTGKIIYDENYPSLPIALGYGKDKKEAVQLFLEYFLEIGYTFVGVYAMGDSLNDFGMLEYVKSLGGVGNLIGSDIPTFADFVEMMKKDTQEPLKLTFLNKKNY